MRLVRPFPRHCSPSPFLILFRKNSSFPKVDHFSLFLFYPHQAGQESRTQSHQLLLLLLSSPEQKYTLIFESAYSIYFLLLIKATFFPQLFSNFKLIISRILILRPKIAIARQAHVIVFPECAQSVPRVYPLPLSCSELHWSCCSDLEQVFWVLGWVKISKLPEDRV